MLHVGLTGNIATGKSYAAKAFSALGASIIDADRVAHEILASGTSTYLKILDAFGQEILGRDREIDRKKLGQIVFSDSGKRSMLNALTHPEVGAEIRRRMAALGKSSSGEIIIVDAALMIETGGYKIYDCLIVVACDPSLQVSRIMSRDGLTEAEARARMASQMPMEEKLRLADYTIDTSGTFEQTDDQVKAVYRELLIREQQMKARTKPGGAESGT
jgi:dephospho-CoA kinase